MRYNLKFQLFKLEKALAFQIYEQTEEWRYDYYKHKNYFTFTYKKLEIASEHCNSRFVFWVNKNNLSLEKLNLLGNATNIYNVCLVQEITNKKRDEFYKSILEALKEWSKHVYKITNREPQEFQELENGVFIV